MTGSTAQEDRSWTEGWQASPSPYNNSVTWPAACADWPHLIGAPPVNLPSYWLSGIAFIAILSRFKEAPIGSLEKTSNLVGGAWGPFGHMTMAGNLIGWVVSGLKVTLIGVQKFFKDLIFLVWRYNKTWNYHQEVKNYALFMFDFSSWLWNCTKMNINVKWGRN